MPGWIAMARGLTALPDGCLRGVTLFPCSGPTAKRRACSLGHYCAPSCLVWVVRPQSVVARCGAGGGQSFPIGPWGGQKVGPFMATLALSGISWGSQGIGALIAAGPQIYPWIDASVLRGGRAGEAWASCRGPKTFIGIAGFWWLLARAAGDRIWRMVSGNGVADLRNCF